MSVYLYVILAYLLVLTGYNIYRSRQIKSQDDFMVAGRSLSLTKMVFTLVCTWIGSGTFIAGAEFASYAGWSAVWQPAGAFLGIAIIYFIAAKIRTFGQYTIGDILEVRYGRFARLFGAIALIIAFTTIVSYQFRAGGEILNVVTDGAISPEVGQVIAAIFVIMFVTIGGMVAVAHTDLPNGIIIVSACLLALPFVVSTAGGWSHARDVLPPGHFEVFSPDFGKYPALKALSYFLSTLFLLLGVQSMYQKFYAAKSPAEAKKATAIWIVGTIVVETIVIGIAVYAASYNVEHHLNWSGRSLVLNAARYMVPTPVGVLLLGAACAVVLSTGMNYLLSSSSNVIRDIYQKMINPASDPEKMVGLQKVFIVVMGLCAFVMIFIPTYFKLGDLGAAVRLLRLHHVWRLGDAGALRGPDLEAGDAPGRRGVDCRRRAGHGVLRSAPALSRAVRHDRHRRVGHPQLLSRGRHLHRPARRGEPPDAAAADRRSREAVPGGRTRRHLARHAGHPHERVEGPSSPRRRAAGGLAGCRRGAARPPRRESRRPAA